MVLVLDQTQGYGRAGANNTESWELQNLPAGHVFCAMMSNDQNYDHGMYVYVNGELLRDARYRNTATIKVPVTEGSTVRIDVTCVNPGYYAIGWGHSTLDTNPEHWQMNTVSPRQVQCENMSAWTPVSKSYSIYNINSAPPPATYDPYAVQATSDEGRAENYLRAARFEGTKPTYDGWNTYYPEAQNFRMGVNSPVIQPGYTFPVFPAKGSMQMSSGSGGSYWDGMGWAGYMISERPTWGGVVNNSQVWQTGEVFRLPAETDFLPYIPIVEVGNHPEEPWGTIAVGTSQGQLTGGTFSITKYSSSTNRPGSVTFKLMEPGAFTKTLINTPYTPGVSDYETYFLSAYPKGQLNKWGPTHIGFQTGIGFPMHTTSMMSPGASPVNFWGDSNGEPGQAFFPYAPDGTVSYLHYTSFNDGDFDNRPVTLREQISFTFPNHESFAATDLDEPGNPKRYVGVSIALTSREVVPPVWNNYTTYDAPHGYNMVWFKGMSLTKTYQAPPTLSYKGFPLYGDLKVKTSAGWEQTGIYKKFTWDPITYDPNSVGVLQCQLPDGTWAPTFRQGFLYGQGWGTPLNIKVEEGWQIAALMTMPPPPPPPVPVNDLLADALLIDTPAGTITGLNNESATTDTPAPLPRSRPRSIWWYFTLTAPSTISFRITAAASWDSYLNVYLVNAGTTLTDAANLTWVVGDDDSGGGGLSWIQNYAAPAGTYALEVASYSTSNFSNDFEITWSGLTL